MNSIEVTRFSSLDRSIGSCAAVATRFKKKFVNWVRLMSASQSGEDFASMPDWLLRELGVTRSERTVGTFLKYDGSGGAA